MIKKINTYDIIADPGFSSATISPMKKLFCIKELKDPRDPQIIFEEHDYIVFQGSYIEINGVEIRNIYGISDPSITEEKINLYKKAKFFQDLLEMDTFTKNYMNNFFVELSLYREKQISDLFDEEN
jgi:hypothetical protein